MLQRPLSRFLTISSRCRHVNLRDAFIKAHFQRYHSVQAVEEVVEVQQDDFDMPKAPKAKYRFRKTRRINRTGHQFSENRANLGVNTLGQPAEVLIIQDTEEGLHRNAEGQYDHESSTKDDIELVGKEPYRDLSPQHQEILENLQDEQRAKQTTKAEQQASVNAQLEELRPQNVTGLMNPVLSRTELAKLIKKLDGFTMAQLTYYYNKVKRSNTKETKELSSTQQDISTVPWWPWPPGKLKSPHYFKRSGQKILKFSNRQVAISMILRQLWEVDVQGETGFAGHVWREFDDSAISVLSVGSEAIKSSFRVHEINLARS
jgi:hypothetical protein